MSETWPEVSSREQAVALALNECCATVPTSSARSPIDTYYEAARHIFTLGTTDTLEASPTLGRLLVLGLVGNVEVYLRTVITGIIRICPIARTAAASHPIPYGAVAHYGDEGPELGLFESISLADAKQIRSRTDKLIGLSVPNAGSLAAALDEFDRVCELRHASIHQHGALNSGNAAVLGIQSQGHTHVVVSVDGLQSVAAICQNLVRAYNRFAFEGILRRWSASGVLSGTWDRDKARFQPLFVLMHSAEDGEGPRRAYDAFRRLTPTLIQIASRQAVPQTEQS